MTAVCRSWLSEEAPARRLAVVRILVGAYAVVFVAIRSFHWLDVARLPERRFDPVGVLGWLDQPFTAGPVAVAPRPARCDGAGPRQL